MNRVLIWTFILLSNLATSINAQVDYQSYIKEKYDTEALTKKIIEVRKWELEQKWKGRIAAVKYNMDTIGVVGLDLNGYPLYHSNTNTTAATTTRTNELHDNGLSGYNLEGSGLNIGVWEVNGTGNPGHEAFIENGVSRLIVKDSLLGFARHAAHVSGTLISNGIALPTSKGMAPKASCISYDTDLHLNEMLFEAMNGMLVSNHSYGFDFGYEPKFRGQNGVIYYQYRHTLNEFVNGLEHHLMGKYIEHSRWLDDVCYSAPFYLPFFSAGNQRDDNPVNGDSIISPQNILIGPYIPGSNPLGDGIINQGFDNLSSYAVAKNAMVVGAIDGNANNAQAAFSSWGPTDDGRIKPDIVGHGVNLTSCDTTDNSYYSQSGTSMASPNIAGSALLLQELYIRLFNVPMKSATLKALILHTATDLGNPGPDYSNGWGLLNARSAADLVNDAANGMEHFIIEDSSTNLLELKGLRSSCNDAPIITLAYTDLPGTPSQTTLIDPSTPKLVHDLDIFVSNPDNTNDLPFILDPANPANNATTGDNDVDNVEQVIGQSGFNLQLLSILREGSFQHDQQYSLILSNVDEMCSVIFNQGPEILTKDEDFCNYVAISSRAMAYSEHEFTSPIRVTFKPGFHAVNGSSITVKILPSCQ